MSAAGARRAPASAALLAGPCGAPPPRRPVPRPRPGPPAPARGVRSSKAVPARVGETRASAPLCYRAPGEDWLSDCRTRTRAESSAAVGTLRTRRQRSALSHASPPTADAAPIPSVTSSFSLRPPHAPRKVSSYERKSRGSPTLLVRPSRWVQRTSGPPSGERPPTPAVHL